MGLIYLDTCLVIYAFERHPQFSTQVLQRLSEYPATQFAISPLVKMECLVAPFDQRLCRADAMVLSIISV